MKLQILVPQYHETDTIVQKLLDSIAMQRGVDFNEVGVIIVSDGVDVMLSPEMLRRYPFRVRYMVCEHRGVSATRNTCLDLAEAEYVMFCDADDCFYNALGLWMIFQDIDKGGFDMRISRFMEECRHPIDGRLVYISHSNDSVFVHGKVFRRQFLLDRHIRWNERLTVHEDSYFNMLCKAVSQNSLYCDVPFYMWCWRADSVARSSEDYMLQTYPQLLTSVDTLRQEFADRGLQDHAVQLIASAVLDLYYVMQQPEWRTPEHAAYRRAATERFAALWPAWEPVFAQVDPKDFMELSSSARERHIAEGMGMEKETFTQWLQEMQATA